MGRLFRGLGLCRTDWAIRRTDWALDRTARRTWCHRIREGAEFMMWGSGVKVSRTFFFFFSSLSREVPYGMLGVAWIAAGHCKWEGNVNDRHDGIWATLRQ